MPNVPVPAFLVGENPAHARYREAVELFALFDYLKAQRFGVFSIRESFQAVSEGYDGTLKGFHLSVDQAWEAIEYMDSLGVGAVELPAFPANRYGQAYNRDLLQRAEARGVQIEYAAHARCVEADIRAAIETGFRRLHLYIGTSKIKQATARAAVPQLAEKAFEAIRLARELGATCIRISTEDAFRTTLDDYETFYRVLHQHLQQHNLRVEGIGIPDTVGLGTIDELGDRIAVLRAVGMAFDWLECHVHNDIGNADRTYVDVLMLCRRLGIQMLPDFSILGIGERNGTLGLSSLLEAIYRRLILFYPRKMSEIRREMRDKLGVLPSGQLFVNRYRDMDSFFYRIMAEIGFIFDRSPFSANTEFDGSGVHADTTLRAFQLAYTEGREGQAAVDVGNSAYAGALPPYDMPLRRPALACFGCGKSNVRYWRDHEGLGLRSPEEITQQLSQFDPADQFMLDQPYTEAHVDELIAQIIRCYSIRYNGISHRQAMEIVRLFYA